MPNLPQVKPRDVEKVLIAKGFSGRTTKSGHRVFSHPDGRHTVVSSHNGPIPKGTLRAILRQADIPLDEFIDLI